MPEEAKPVAGAPEQGSGASEPRKKARVTDPRKGGVVGKAVDAVTAPLAAIRLPQLDWKLVSYGLLILIAIILVARNWAPVRINIFGWYLDLPKAIAFTIFFALGVLSMWLLGMRGTKRKRVKVTPPVVEVVDAVDESDEEIDDDSELLEDDESLDGVEVDEQDGS